MEQLTWIIDRLHFVSGDIGVSWVNGVVAVLQQLRTAALEIQPVEIPRPILPENLADKEGQLKSLVTNYQMSSSTA